MKSFVLSIKYFLILKWNTTASFVVRHGEFHLFSLYPEKIELNCYDFRSQSDSCNLKGIPLERFWDLFANLKGFYAVGRTSSRQADRFQDWEKKNIWEDALSISLIAMPRRYSMLAEDVYFIWIELPNIFALNEQLEANDGKSNL